MPGNTPADCAQDCSMYISPDLVGFGVLDVTSSIYCDCYYSGQNLPSPPAGLDFFFNGTGPIGGSDGFQSTDCYAFAQVREVFTSFRPPNPHFSLHYSPLSNATGYWESYALACSIRVQFGWRWRGMFVLTRFYRCAIKTSTLII